MNTRFIICNYQNLQEEFLDLPVKLTVSRDVNILLSQSVTNKDGIYVAIDGFVCPVNSIFHKYHLFSQEDLIIELYSTYGENFIQYVKGFFVIVIITPEKVLIVNDIHSVKRFYYSNKSNRYFITNDPMMLKHLDKLNPNPYAAPMLAAFQHFVEGYTLFEDVFYSKPASIFFAEMNQLKMQEYLDIDYFAGLSKQKITINDFMSEFQTSIHNQFSFLNCKKPALTLSGGRDTRTILATLLRQNISPHCFSYGNPKSMDNQTATNIADKLKLDYHNFHIENLNCENYDTIAFQLFRNANPFIHLHRTYRMHAAIEAEKQISPDIIYTGFMGGDYIMGESFNDYIITEFLRRYLTYKESENELFKSIFSKHFIITKNHHIDFVKTILKKLKLRHQVFDKMSEYRIVHQIIGCTHDIQDLNIFMNEKSFVSAPFMDRDIMSLLFASEFSMFFNSKHSKNPFARLKGGELQCTIIKHLSPQLASIPFTNRYTPDDVLGNRLKYVLKRTAQQFFKPKTVPSFSYENWFSEFINLKINNFGDNINNMYNTEKLISSFYSNIHLNNEGYWHPFTNPLTLDLYYKQLIS